MNCADCHLPTCDPRHNCAGLPDPIGPEGVVIKPCPFCGNVALELQACSMAERGNRLCSYRLECRTLSCLAAGPLAESGALAVQAWNRR